jgi:MFS family permease
MGFVFLVASAIISTRLINRFGVRSVVVMGMLLQTVGYTLMTRVSLGESYLTGLLPTMLIISGELVFSFTAVNVAALAGTKRDSQLG